MKIAYQGSKNNYSSLALKEFGKKLNFSSNAEFEAYSSYDSLFKSSSEYAFFAIQNSSSSLNGLFSKINEFNWHVVAEYFWSTPLDLSGSGSVDDVKYVVGVDHVLSICKSYFSESKYQFISVDDTSEACQFAESHGKEYAAVAPKFTASQFNLKSFASKIEDSSSLTRFYLVSKENVSMSQLFAKQSFYSNFSSNPFKSSFIVKLSNQSGSLHKAIGCFSNRNINISQVESYSSSRSSSSYSPWEHYFLFDIDGDLKDSNVNSAVENLKEFANEVIVLGSYPSLSQEQSVSPVGN